MNNVDQRIEGFLVEARAEAEAAREALNRAQTLVSDLERLLVKYKNGTAPSLPAHTPVAKALVAKAAPSTSSVKIAHQRPPTIPDIVERILRGIGKPVHAKEIAERLAKKGIDSNSERVANRLTRDSKRRFVNVGRNTFALKSQLPGGQSNANGNAGAESEDGLDTAEPDPNEFSLSAWLKGAIQGMQGEFTAPMLFKRLVEEHADVTAAKNSANVTATLVRFTKQGLLDEVKKGGPNSVSIFRRKAHRP